MARVAFNQRESATLFISVAKGSRLHLLHYRHPLIGLILNNS
jgi:hypothetical protein